MKKGDTYRGFRVVEVMDCVKDCDAPGIYLRHERTGMEVFHVLKEDDENLFAFVFRTPVKDSTGVAHVIEHSVLCGSEKYPLKDPFIRLSNQSLATYLNAFTSMDYTAFPSSSVVKADYFNTFSVYADAVFFPLLKEEVFLQEGHRIEFDEKGRPSIQGVVYNEMKGKYSSYESVISDGIDNVVFNGTRYTNDSGGDPMAIPSLTYGRFKAFHRKHYTPANCMLFLYGNIPTEEQLDFIDANVLSRISAPGKRVPFPPFPTDSKVPSRARVYGPSSEDETKDSVVCAWRLFFPDIPRKQQRIELMFLNNLLWNSDSAPVSKALLESRLGDDIAPQTGVTFLQYHSVACGLRGTDSKCAGQVKRIIFSELEKICREGLKEEIMDRICMTFDFFNREISRDGGPQGLVMLRRCLGGWIYGENPWEFLELYDDFKKLKSRLDSDPGYLSTMIRRYFLDNPNFTVVTASPSLQWIKKRERMEKENLRNELALMGREKAGKKFLRMLDFQKTPEPDELVRNFPRISTDQLEVKVWDSPVRSVEIGGIPLFMNREPTNGIVYFDLYYAIDGLTPEEYRYASIVAGTCTDVGWGKLSWSESQNMQQRLTGNLVPHTESMDCAIHDESRNSDYVGRDWMVITVSVLEDKLEPALKMLSDMLLNVDYRDTERLMNLINSSVNSFKSGLAYYSNIYAWYRARRKADWSSTLNELWSGLTSSFTMKELSRMDPDRVASRLRTVLKKILSGGSIMHVVSTAEGISRTKKLLPDFVEKLSLRPVGKKPVHNHQKMIKLTELSGEVVNPPSKGKGNPYFIDEVMLLNGTVGTVYSALQSSPYGTRASVAESVFCHGMSNSELWDLIRTKGGAYGVSFFSKSIYLLSGYGTYRDPKPFDSARTIRDALIESVKKDYDDGDVEKSIIGCYSSTVEPVVPSERGLMAFNAILHGAKISDRKKTLKFLFSLSKDDVHKAAERYSKWASDGDPKFSTVVFCPKNLFLSKNKENTGIIINLTL